MKLIIRTMFAALLLTVALTGLLILRNNQIDQGIRALKDGNGDIALERLEPLAKIGDKTAQMIVGTMYAEGIGGVTRSEANAMYWFRRLGASGPVVVGEGVDPAAPYALSVAKDYASGTGGVKIDRAESIKWLKLAARCGSKEAISLLANFNELDVRSR